VELLNTIFELDKSDLDFGIYRILNIRKAEIEKFLKTGLPGKVQETLAPFADNKENIKSRMTEIEKQATDAGIEITASPKWSQEYASLKAQLAAGTDINALETDVYSALYNFFSRYYDEGDFISKRRYKEGVYAIPYEGEEVKLYWANQDQYYIKTTENFKDYTFKNGGKTVHFRIVDASTEQNNNKEQDDSKREFMLWTPTKEMPDLKTIEVNDKDDEMIIRFIYDIPPNSVKKSEIKANNYKTIGEAIIENHKNWNGLIAPIPSKDPKKTKTLLEKHLEAYIAKNTFDYFIHKDLGGFLSRELDFYIKNEIVHLDDIDTINEKRVETYLAKVKAVKQVGKIIINFLAQIENFQKKLWLKKKFVVSADWCITLDRIDESFYEEIRNNKAQVQEWIDLYAIDEIKGDLTTTAFSNPPTIQFLKDNKNLIVDTKHFSSAFKEKLIAGFDNLDEVTDGVLIHSENFQALNLLQERYREKVKCIYIDPPYNADASEILYKNGFKHSSWLSMMESRLCLAVKTMSIDSMICVTIDDYEKDNASILLQEVFGVENLKGIVPIRNNPQGRSTVKGFAVNHEYALFSSKNDAMKSVGRLDHSQKQKDRYSETDDQGNAYLWENFRKTGTDSNHGDRPKQFYPIYVNKNSGSFRVPELSWEQSTNAWKINDKLKQDEVEVLPISDNGEEKVWKWGIERITNNPNHIKIEINKSGIQIYRRNYYNDDGSLPNTWWDKAQYAAGSHGTNLLTNIFGVNRKFLFPKSVYAEMDCLTICNALRSDFILDFFAGSATTGHAVLNLNREDGGNRKYILVEMGEYFNTVTKPRMQKVIYADSWKDGKPLSRNTGVSHIMKYFRLESYEDTLTNIVLSDETQRQYSFLGEDYLINYMLDTEAKGSLLNLEQFKMPFEYKLKITEKNETKETLIDIPETFNYLIGLTVIRQGAIHYFKSNPDEKGGGYEGAVSLKPHQNGEYAFKQIEGKLRDEKRVLIIWRNITEDLSASNAALDAYFQKYRINPQDREYDLIYVNGDNNLENLKLDEEHWKVNLIEYEFKTRMFGGLST
jgi:adenine-specific DNA-methyltransferase